jgi:hypothetical protein
MDVFNYRVKSLLDTIRDFPDLLKKGFFNMSTLIYLSILNFSRRSLWVAT